MKYIEDKINLDIRFSEVDSMGIVWHGNYLKYMEDAREFLGNKLGMNYLEVHDHGYYIPIVRVNLDYKAPLYLGDRVEVQIILEHSKAAKIIHRYSILNLTTDTLACKAYSEQVFIDRNTRKLELYKPEMYAAWCDQIDWKTK